MEKPKCKLQGESGNVYFIIGKVSRELKRAGDFEGARKFQEQAVSSKSYDEVLQLCFDYVDVE